MSHTKLRPVGLEDIEMLRKWRNNPEINRYLINRGYLTKKRQSSWFKNLDNNTHKYYIIEYINKGIGCASLINIDSLKKTAEPGVFIGDTDFHIHPVAAASVLLILKIGFEEIGLDVLTSKVAVENKKALELYKKMGFRITDCDENYKITICSREDYQNIKNKMSVLFPGHGDRVY